MALLGNDSTGFNSGPPPAFTLTPGPSLDVALVGDTHTRARCLHLTAMFYVIMLSSPCRRSLCLLLYNVS